MDASGLFLHWTRPLISPSLRNMSKAAEATELTVEDALGKLESIVETMEGGELPLEQLLSRYEEGTHLVKFCQEKLAAAELRLQQLDPQGMAATPEPSWEPADSQPEQSSPAVPTV